MVTFARARGVERDPLTGDEASSAVTNPEESCAPPGLEQAIGHGNQAILMALSAPDLRSASSHGPDLPMISGPEPHALAPAAQQATPAPVDSAPSSPGQVASDEVRSSVARPRSAPNLTSAVSRSPSPTAAPSPPAQSPPSPAITPPQLFAPAPQDAQSVPALDAAQRRFEEQICASIDAILAGADTNVQELNQDGVLFEAALAQDTHELEQSVTQSLSETQALVESQGEASRERLDQTISDETGALSTHLTHQRAQLRDKGTVAQESISAGAQGAQERTQTTGAAEAAEVQEAANAQHDALRTIQPQGADEALGDAQREADRRIASGPAGQLSAADEQARADLNHGAAASASLMGEISHHTSAVVQEGLQSAQVTLSETGEEALGGLGALQEESHTLLHAGSARVQEGLNEAHTALLQRARDTEQDTIRVDRERRARLAVELQARAADGAEALSSAASEASEVAQAAGEHRADEGVEALDQGAALADERAMAFALAMGEDTERHRESQDERGLATHNQRLEQTSAEVLAAQTDAERQSAGLDELADEAIQRGEQGGAEARAAVTAQATATTSEVDAVVSMAHGRVGEAEERASELLGTGAEEAIQAREDALVTPTQDAQSDARETIRADHERSGLERALDFAAGLMSGAWDAMTAIASAVAEVVVPRFMIVAGALSQLLSNALFGLLNPVLDLVPNEAFHQGRDIGEDLSLIVGLVETVAGLAVILAGITVTTGGGGLVTAGSGGLLAVPAGGVVVAVDSMLITVGGVLIADGLIMLSMSGKGSRHQERFREMLEAEDRGSGSKRGKQRDGTPGNNGAQNKQVDAVVSKYKLTHDERDSLHDQISGQDYSYAEIVEAAEALVRARKTP